MDMGDLVMSAVLVPALRVELPGSWDRDGEISRSANGCVHG